MEQGWIKLHRKMVDKGFYKKSQYFHLWVHLLMLANHTQKEFMWNGNIILIKEGQMITGRKQLSDDTGIPESTIEDILKFLESQHQIQQQKTTKYRLITIVNWIKHQNPDSKSNNRATTEQQQADTNKNVIMNKNEKKDTSDKSPKYNPLGSEIIKAFEEVDPKNKTYYGNKTQRASCDFLLSEYGIENVLKAIKILPQINQKKLYIKQITTPFELKENWVKIGNAIRQTSITKKVAF